MSSGFISETEITEARKKRQEEWERVRKATDPLERPEEPFDSRSLYDRLQEQKQKRDLEYEEAHKLKNMIKGLDDDEIEFLDLVDRTKLAADKRKTLEEEQELNDYRNRVATLQEKTHQEKLQVTIAKPKVTSNSKLSQTKLLMGAVVKKNEPQKRKAVENKSPSKQVKLCKDGGERTTYAGQNVGLTCIGVLPGIGPYSDSSSEHSSDSEVEAGTSKIDLIDLLGRKVSSKKEKDE